MRKLAIRPAGLPIKPSIDIAPLPSINLRPMVLGASFNEAFKRQRWLSTERKRQTCPVAVAVAILTNMQW